MKLKILAIAALLSTPFLAAPVRAQQQVCVVDNIRNEVVCGRLATEREIRRANPQGRYNNGQYDDRYDRNSNRRSNNYYPEINRIYQQVLGRDAEYSGIQNHVRALQDGQSLNDVRRSIARSSEARQRINQIYREVLGRDADSNGMEGWVRSLERGRSLNDIRRDIENSEEARSRRGG